MASPRTVTRSQAMTPKPFYSNQSQAHTPTPSSNPHFTPSANLDLTTDDSMDSSLLDPSMTSSTETPSRNSRPIYDPSSPFVYQAPMSVDGRLKSRMFGQGLDGGYLVSPMAGGPGMVGNSSPITGHPAGTGRVPQVDTSGRTTPRPTMVNERMRSAIAYEQSPVKIVGQDEEIYSIAAMGMGMAMASPWNGMGIGGMEQPPASSPAYQMMGPQPRGIDFQLPQGLEFSHMTEDGAQLEGQEVIPGKIDYIGSNLLAYGTSPSKYPPSLSARNRRPQQQQTTIMPQATTPTRSQPISEPTSAVTSWNSPSQIPGSAPSWGTNTMNTTPSSAHKRHASSAIPTSMLRPNSSISPSHQRSLSANMPSTTATSVSMEASSSSTMQIIPMQGVKRLRQVTNSGIPTAMHSPLGPGRQQLHQISDGVTRRQRPIVGRSVSAVVPPAGSAGSSRNPSPALQNLPFTTRPLVHQFNRAISSSSTMTTSTSGSSSWEYPASPTLFVPGSSVFPSDGATFPGGLQYIHQGNFSFGGGDRSMPFHGGHSRQVSNATSGYLDTPLLEHSMQGSPELGRSPLGTPQLGLDGQPLIQSGYYTSPTESNFSFNQSGGIAQRMDSLAVSSQGQHGQANYQGEPPKLDGEAQTDNHHAYQYQQPTYGYGSLPVQYQAYPPGALYQWPTQQDFSTTFSPNMEQHQQHQLQRHVSTSYIPSQLHANHQPRSVSANAVPLLPTDMRTGGLFPPSHGFYQTSYIPNDQLFMEPSSSNFQAHSNSSIPPTPTFSEGPSEEPPAKRQKAKFPPVGKRLKPGPKPKPKTPRKASIASQHDQASHASSQFFDPFVIAAQSVGTPSSAHSDAASSQAPNLDITAPIPTYPRVPLLEGEVSSVEQGMAIVPSIVPKAVLETLYECFSIQEDSSAQQAKRYRCNIDDCSREFPRKSAIHSHIQTHLEDKPFMCTEPDW